MEALLVIDMLHDFIDPEGALYSGPSGRDIIPYVARLLDEHRQKGSLIVFVQDSHDVNDKEFERFPPHCLAGQKGSQVIPELAPLPDETILPKKRFSAFFNTNLEKLLKQAKVNQAHLCGVCTSICVMDTCSDLANRDYTVYLHQRGVADFDDEAHQFAMKRMENVLGAKMVD